MKDEAFENVVIVVNGESSIVNKKKFYEQTEEYELNPDSYRRCVALFSALFTNDLNDAVSDTTEDK